jgi:long-chain fatty acid transport protein
MYRSGTSYGANGTLTAPGFLAGSMLRSVPLPAEGFGNLPQSVEFKAQSGIAPGWLAFGSVKWADWSVQRELKVVTPSPLLSSSDIYNWKDGWTVTGGVGHAFNDNVSGALSLTWDRGVATGWDLSSDTYTLAAGGVLKDKLGGELRAGVGVSYLTSARETQYLNAIVPGNPHSGFNSAVDGGWAFAVNLGYKVNW